MVYAKRPLFVNELREAAAVCHTCDGENIDKAQIPFKRKILELCEPLVRVYEVSGPEGGSETCYFCHASVRDFFRNSSLYSDKATSNGYAISSQTMASICLRYLSQPRYMRLLVRNRDSFQDADGGDIMDHAMLVYAAKYWDKHLDAVDPSQALSDMIDKFLRSQQFVTCLQVQSLLVDGESTGMDLHLHLLAHVKPQVYFKSGTAVIVSGKDPNIGGHFHTGLTNTVGQASMQNTAVSCMNGASF